MLDGTSLLVKSSCESGARGRLNYLPCLSCASCDPIFCKIVTGETASCCSMSFWTHQKLGVVHHPLCELTTRTVGVVVPSSWGRLETFISILRLELQEAVLATYVCKMLREELELNIDRTFLWTDSEIVLQYLSNEQRRLQTFVANRVEEIKEHSPLHYWKHVARTLNPADCVKGIDPIFSDS